jgi:osmotically-inducible protein OsmY
VRSDQDIKHDVEAELRWHPAIDASDIGVAVCGGVVTLSGFVRSYVEKLEAEEVAKRIAGVAGIANDIDVRLPGRDMRPDPEIARDVALALKSQLPSAAERIKVVVEDGWVTLQGVAEWNYERSRAAKVARRQRGVRGVNSLILLKPRLVPEELKRKIERALRRNAAIDANLITVEANAGEVILKGTVRSWAEREEAERAAWAAPGVTKVENYISVEN